MPNQITKCYFEDVLNQLKAVPTDSSGMRIPVGVNPYGGSLCTVEASQECGINNIILYGPTATGRQGALEFMINGLYEIYPKFACRYYGSVQKRLRRWQKIKERTTGALIGVDDPKYLASAMCVECTRLRNKKTNDPEVIILDELQKPITELDPVGSQYLMEIVHWGSEKNVQLIVVTPAKKELFGFTEPFQINCYVHTAGSLVYRYDNDAVEAIVPIC